MNSTKFALILNYEGYFVFDLDKKDKGYVS